MRGFSWPFQHVFSKQAGLRTQPRQCPPCSSAAVKLSPKYFFILHAGLHHPQQPTKASVAIMDTRARDIKIGDIKTGLGKNGRKIPKSFLQPRSQAWHNPEPSQRVQTSSSMHCPANAQCILALAWRQPLPPQPERRWGPTAGERVIPPFLHRHASAHLCS